MTKHSRYRATKKIKACIALWMKLSKTHRTPEVLYAMTTACGVPSDLVHERLQANLEFLGLDKKHAPAPAVRS